MHRQSLRTAVALGIAAALVIGLSLAGRAARDWLDGRGHYHVALADLDCAAPPSVARADFLAEVQYLGGLPDQLSTLDPAVALRVAAAFALHPWVERVAAVRLRAADGPRVELIFRTPALAVGGRVVDGQGVLLPAAAPADGLIALRGEVPPPAGPAGAPWGDAAVEGAARTVVALRPFQDCLRLTDAELTPDGLTFTGRVRLRWGKPEPGNPAAVEAKLARLREACAKPGGPGNEIDLRAAP
jgi:hypothetical protein